MPKLDEATNLYERTEAICNAIKGKRNLAQKDTATIGLMVVLNEIADSGMTIEQLLEQGDTDAGKTAKEWRIKVRDQIQPLFTASKNYQNSYCEPSGLMPKAVGNESTEEFA